MKFSPYQHRYILKKIVRIQINASYFLRYFFVDTFNYVQINIRSAKKNYHVHTERAVALDGIYLKKIYTTGPCEDNTKEMDEYFFLIFQCRKKTRMLLL